MTRAHLALAAALLASASVPARGQEALWNLPIQNMLAISNAAISGHVVRTVASRAVGQGAAQSAAAPASQAPAATATDTQYVPTRALSQQVRSEVIGRFAEQNPQGAQVAERELGKHDYGKIYSRIVAPFGLERGDVADAMTAYTLLGWMIATGNGDPTREQVAAVRRQMAGQLASAPMLADAQARAKLGEELALMFVILHAGWQSAQREGNLDQYSDGVANLFARQTGKDPRSLVLTDAGLRSQG